MKITNEDFILEEFKHINKQIEQNDKCSKTRIFLLVFVIALIIIDHCIVTNIEEIKFAYPIFAFYESLLMGMPDYLIFVLLLIFVFVVYMDLRKRDKLVKRKLELIEKINAL